jgi:small-conductance mechanosensitive channel
MATVTLDPVALVRTDAAQVVSDFATPAVAAAIAVVLALVAASVIRRVLRVLGTRWSLLASLSVRVKWPLRLLLATIGLWLAIFITTGVSEQGILEQAMFIVGVIAGAWLLVEVTRSVQDGIGARFPIDMADNRHARRVQTQAQILERLIIALIITIAAAAILLSFPGMRALGASILASAGLAAIVAGIAAQSSLANVFAGLQVAFADAIRVDDVVIVEEEYGRIEEITLTYVVVRIWDDRRMILPSTYFTNTPFENWTRTASELVGTVELDVDWTVPVDGMREELDRLLGETDLWDGRSAGIQVTEATGGLVRVRASASAESAPKLWDLRCYLREGLVGWVQRSGAGVPRTRWEGLSP